MLPTLTTLFEHPLYEIFTTAKTWIIFIAGSLFGLAFLRIREGLFGVVGRRLRRMSVMNKNTLIAQREIQARTDTLQHQFKALRVCVMQFHNGEFFALANHAWKLTVTHESPGPGIGMLANVIRGLPATTLLDIVDPLFDPTSDHLPPGIRLISPCLSEAAKNCRFGKAGHRILHYDAAAMQMNTSRAIMNTNGIYHAFHVPLFDDRTKNVIGLLSMQFGELYDDIIQAREVDLCVMCKAAEEIQYYLTTDYDYYRKQIPLLLRWIFPEQKCN